jgi:hypothetical protein
MNKIRFKSYFNAVGVAAVLAATVFVQAQELEADEDDWIETESFEDEPDDSGASVETGKVAESKQPGWKYVPGTYLLKTTWSQGVPYMNNLITEDGTPGTTGCGTIALAQILNYHKYPPGTTDTIPALPQVKKGPMTLDLPPVTFDWNNLKDIYRGNGVTNTEAEINAVAELVYAVFMMRNGIGIDNTNYFFDYDYRMKRINRNDYATQAEWDSIIKDQIDQGLPVWYRGNGVRDGKTFTGHAFVIDGYDSSGNFHVNFGWNGKYNGFHPITMNDTNALRAGDRFWSYKQGAIINLKPAANVPGNQLIRAVGKGGTYKLEGNIDGDNDKIPYTLNVKNDFTLDLNGYTLTIDVLSKALGSDGIKIASGKTLTIMDSKSGGVLNVSTNNVHLGRAAINTADGTLIIESGTVNATGGTNSAGIGGGLDGAGGKIIINGGTVNAIGGGSGGAGIGGGYGKGGNGGEITINGGTVTATGGNYGAGIGGGRDGDGGTITITGGTVTANGGSAGIGGGRNSSGGTGAGGDITITGGTVTATGNNSSAGIGSGAGGAGGNVTITGGTVTATGSNNSAGIGSSRDGAGGTITITDGIVTATGGQYGAGIGSGRDGVGGTITITGGTVTATGAQYAAGIGSGYSGAGGNVTIASGTVTATGGQFGAGIGSGRDGVGGTITITGGTVTANGGDAGIGGGRNSSGGNEHGSGGDITITGGIVTATGGTNSAGIGGGSNRGAGGNITINGGTVTATGNGNAVGIGNGNGGTAGTLTMDGNALVFTNSIGDATAKTSGILVIGNTTTWYGEDVIKLSSTDYAIPSGKTLTIQNGKTLEIPSGAMLTNSGTIANNGTIANSGIITLCGGGTLTGNPVEGNQPISTCPAIITAHPVGGTATVGTEFSLSVTAASPDGGTLSYQWFIKTPEDEANAITEATNTTYATPTSSAGMYKYFVVVTNTVDDGDVSVASNVATLTVTEVITPPSSSSEDPSSSSEDPSSSSEEPSSSSEDPSSSSEDPSSSSTDPSSSSEDPSSSSVELSSSSVELSSSSEDPSSGSADEISSSSEDSTPIAHAPPAIASETSTYYNIKGEPVGSAKPAKPGVYLVKQGNSIRKIVVR